MVWYFFRWGQLSQLFPLPISSLLAGEGWQHEKQRRPWCCASTAQQLLKHLCVISTVLVTDLKLSVIQAAVKKTTFIPARPSTPGITGVRLVYKYVDGIEV